MRAAAAALLLAAAASSCRGVEFKKFTRGSGYVPERGEPEVTVESGARFRYADLYLDVGGGTKHLMDGTSRPLTSAGLWWYSKPLRVGYRGEVTVGSPVDSSHFFLFEVEW